MKDEIEVAAAKLTRISIEHWAKENNFDFQIDVETDSFTNKLKLVLSGLKNPIDYSFTDKEFLVYEKVFGTTYFPKERIPVIQGEKISKQMKEHILEYNSELNF